MYAHTPIHALRELMLEHAFQGADVAHILVEGNATFPTHHNITEPRDITQAQYSVPFCVALALYRNPEDPKSFDAGALEDPAIRAACRAIELRVLAQGRTNKSSRVTVRLKDGREFVRACEWFKGMPDHPLNRAELRAKFMLLTSEMGEAAAAQLFGRLERIESAPLFSLA
jgi:2-methylcitrate dehydratase PrpD